MQNIFFFQTQTIPDDSNLFNQFKKQNIYFSYFQVDQNYYLLFYRQTPIDLHFLYPSVDVIQELDFKQRKIRSFRGFFLYALEIIKTAKDYQILQTNLQPFFWKKVKDIIRQNKKGALLEFLFGGEVTRMGSVNGRGDSFKSSSPSLKDMENKIQTLQKSYDGLRESVASSQAQVDSLTLRITSLAQQVEKLQQKVIYVETLLNNSKYPLSDSLEAPNDIKIIQKGNSTMEVKKGPYLTENQSEVRNPTSQTKDIQSKNLSDHSKIDFKVNETSEQYNSPLNQEKELSEASRKSSQQNFITLSQISEQDKIQIIKTGFQLQAEGKISLKKYYESTDPNSLFQFKGYSIKYETIRRTKLYQQLKP